VKVLGHIRWYLIVTGLAVLTTLCAASVAVCQTEDSFGDAAADPVKLFEQGQNAHARGELEKALDFYERAIEIRPEFPEAEFQRGNVLVALGRFPLAHSAFERAIALRTSWSLPYSALGALLVREEKQAEAERVFRQALTVNEKDDLALRMLAEIRLRAGDSKEALSLARRATQIPNAPVGAWVIQAMAERMSGDRAAARISLERALESEPENVAALLERAELELDQQQFEGAISDLNHALKLRAGDKQILSRLAYAYDRAGKPEEAKRYAQSAGLKSDGQLSGGGNNVSGTAEEIEAANSNDPVKARKALERLLEKNPDNAALLSKLGASYRKDDPARSLEYYRRAATIKPDNPEYAVGYAAALVQARRFAEAVTILRAVLSRNPDTYTARANLATALYELKQYAEAVPEYEWLLRDKPEMSVAYYFIATAHDYLGEYPEALNAYETFLARADETSNKLEIEKVRLRLPRLRKQIQLGEGVKRKNK